MSQGGRGQYGQPGALTSLGAVGGPRGTGAGVTRILTQFVTQYIRGGAEQAAADIAKLQAQQVAAQNQLLDLGKRQAVEQESLNRAANGKVLLDKASQAELGKLLTAQKQVTAEINLYGRAGKDATANLLDAERSFKNQSNLARGVTLDIVNQAGTQRELNVLLEQRAAIEQQIAELNQQQAAAQKEQYDIHQALRGLGGLAIGAIGGTVGGFLLGNLAFGPVQDALEGLKKGISDLLDPMAAVKQEAKDLGDAVNSIASDKNLSQLEAAKKLLQDIAETTKGSGGLGFGAADSKDIAAAEAERLALDQQLIPTMKTQLDLLKQQGQASSDLRDVNRDIIALRTGLPNPNDPLTEIREVIDGLAFGSGTLVANMNSLSGAAQDVIPKLEEQQRIIDAETRGLAAAQALTEQFGGQALDQALQHYTDSVQQATDVEITSLRHASDVHIDILRHDEQAEVTSIQRRTDARIRALQQASQRLDNGDTRSSRTKSLQAQLDALSTQGPSEDVKRLTDALEGLRRKQAEVLAQRKQIEDAEKIDLLQLQARLEKQGTSIDIERYTGKERIVAIQAQLDLLQKQTDQQERLNQLLEAQYNISRGIRRNTGESIQDFLNRRAQFYREQLTNAAKAQAAQQEAALKDEQGRLKTLADLHDAEVKQQQDREDAIYAAREKRLEKELSAQQKADQIALTKRRQVLEEELRASQKADANALEARRQELQDEIAAERQKGQDRITMIRHNYEDAIKIQQDETEAAINAAQLRRDKEIQAEKDRIASVKNLLSKDTVDQQVLALNQAKTLSQIMEYAGSVAGSGYSAALLRAQGQALGLQDYVIADLIANADKVHAAYQKSLDNFITRPFDPYAGPHASGFVFPLGNQHQSTPFAMNMRHGEQGEELGIILSHKVTQALRETHNSQPLFGGDFVYNGGGGRREAQKIRRELEGIVDDKLAGRRPSPSRRMHDA